MQIQKTMPNSLETLLFLFPLGLWMTCSASIDLKRLENLSLIGCENSKAEDISHFTLAIPEVDSFDQADKNILASSSFTYQLAPIKDSRKTMVDALDSTNHPTPSIPDHMDSVTPAPSTTLYFARESLVDTLTTGNHKASIQSDQENGASIFQPKTMFLGKSKSFRLFGRELSFDVASNISGCPTGFQSKESDNNIDTLYLGDTLGPFKAVKTDSTNHQDLKHIQAQAMESSKHLSRLSPQGQGPSASTAEICMQPTKRRKIDKFPTDLIHTQFSSIGNVKQSASKKSVVPSVTQTDLKLSDIFKFNVDVFQHPQYKSVRYEFKVKKIISKMRLFCFNDELTIPAKINARRISHFFRKFSMNCVIPKEGDEEFIETAATERRDLLNSAVNCVDSQQSLWFDFWKERTGINFQEIDLSQVPRAQSTKDTSGRDLALLLFHVDMIGTILQNHFLSNPKHYQDYGANLLIEAADLIKQSSWENPFPGIRNNKSTVCLETKRDLKWVWEWIRNFLIQSQEEKLKNIFFKDKNYEIHFLTQCFFTDVFAYSIKKLNHRLLEYSKRTGFRAK
ncbi:hypothetical protein PGT21_034143 [Puccinia graminis f. sp. tritici]|uniref:Uncharacterized protein n=1 Tax=Puccinia graminis f. sp. tritici TaxID=56615 RepID=A0A5B0QCQ6_PUCGR|nr:hypothetical protein PGT21_034143 [Puccinia graminis f. sp. tritici]